jgi:hypothetical protein
MGKGDGLSSNGLVSIVTPTTRARSILYQVAFVDREVDALNMIVSSPFTAVARLTTVDGIG